MKIKQILNGTTPYILNGEFFEIISQNGESIDVKCCHCPAGSIYKGSIKSTGNFHMHIKRKHPNLLPRVHELKLRAFLTRKANTTRKSVKTKFDGNNVVSTTQETIQENKSCDNMAIEVNGLPKDIAVKIEDTSTIVDPVNCINSSNQDCSYFYPQEPTEEPTNETNLNEVLQNIGKTLQNIENGIKHRNQIEAHKLKLEIEKFKFLHPKFNFNIIN